MSKLLFDLGDLIRIKNPGTGMSVEGVVSGHSYSPKDQSPAHVRFRGHDHTYDLEVDFTEITVLERKSVLPTVPGLYTVTPEYFTDSLECYRVFRLTEEDGWSELFSEEEVASVMRDDLTVENFAGRLRKLGVCDG